jgi:hypothetical protein
MSAGSFVVTTYEASYAVAIHPIRVQEETVSASIGDVDNGAVGATVTNPIQARVSGSRRSIGLIARKVRLRLASGSSIPAGDYDANSTTVIPALTRAFYEAATKGAVVSYLGANWIVLSRSGEVPA